MSFTSTVPAAISALYDLVVAAEPDVLVIDGPAVASTGAAEAITIGFQDEQTETVAEVDYGPEGFGIHQASEQYSLICAAAVLNGDAQKMADARNRAYELMAAVGAVLVANQRLNETVMSATIGSHALSEVQTPRGALATVRMTVHVNAFTSP